MLSSSVRCPHEIDKSRARYIHSDIPSHIGDLDYAGLSFSWSDHTDEVISAFACAPDPRPEWALVLDSGAEVVADRLVGQRPCTLVLVRAYREKSELNRCQPKRKSALILLEKGSGDAFHRSHGSSVDHHRSVSTSVRACVRQIEPLRLVEVELDCGDGFFMAEMAPTN